MSSRKRRIYLIVMLFLLLALVFILLFSKSSSYVFVNGKKIRVEIADTEIERERGLMYRESLPENIGMLFVFPASEIMGFWMKNTLIPLDIIFIDENFEIVDIKTALPCYSEQCIIYTSASPARYVLEVNSGFSERNNLGIGDKINMNSHREKSA